MSDLERPKYELYVKPEKLFMQSRGLCMCQKNEDMKRCSEYEPTPQWCKHLSDANGLTCMKAAQRQNC